MNEISCDVCMDLIPLVKDGIASTGSQQAVQQHLKNCEACRALFDGETPPPANTEQAFQKIKRKVQLLSVMLMMFGIFFGLGLTAGNEMFYNSLIMPVIGALGYIIYRRKALYTVPILLFITHCFTNCLGWLRGLEHLDFMSLFMWTIIYSAFSLLGIMIAWLIHFAFKKEN